MRVVSVVVCTCHVGSAMALSCSMSLRGPLGLLALLAAAALANQLEDIPHNE